MVDERIFSNYIKTLDPIHQELLDQIAEIKEQKKQIQQEPFIKENLLKKLYALQSAPEENFKEIIELQKEIEKYRDMTQIKPILEELDRKEKELFDKFIKLPFEMPEYELTPYMVFKTPANTWIKQSINEKGEPSGFYYYYGELEGTTAVKNFKVNVDENGLPCELEWVLIGSETYGYPLRFKRKLVVKNPIIEKLKPKIVEKEVPQYVEKKVIKEKPMIELKCSRCGFDLKECLCMVFCRNCGLSLDKALTENLDKKGK